MWKNFIYLIILCDLYCAKTMAVGTLDDIGSAMTDMNPMIPEEMKEQSKLNAAEIAIYNNYAGDTHKVQTKDGYILTLYCITNPRVQSNGDAVFLLHGILGDSSAWMMNKPGQSAPYGFADAGSSVWLGNTRGNMYSREHIKYSPSEPAFWNFTLDHLAEYDLPAMLDYTMEISKCKKLHYIGHSQATTIITMFSIMQPEYMQNISTVHLYCPVLGLRNSESALIPVLNSTCELLHTFRQTEFLKHSEMPAAVMNLFFSEKSPLKVVSDTALQLIFGYSEKQINETRRPMMNAHFPSGSGFGPVSHYAQLYKYNKLCRYDYGPSENLLIYGQSEPPEYDFNKIEYGQYYLYYSEDDILADRRDVENFRDILQKLDCVQKCFYIRKCDSRFNHMDYTRSMHGFELVYDHTMGIMNSTYSLK